jgi:uncharacterized protein YndB with AHSA1/START domain
MNHSVASMYIEPICKTVSVQATAARAFEVFTAGMARWWLSSNSINPTKSPIARIVIEPKKGGRWYERSADGSECDWGHVLVWEPPTHIVLAWQIDAQWQFNPTLITEVEVRFQAQASGSTEVTLEHRQLERFGAASTSMRAALSSLGGWSGLLDRYATTPVEDHGDVYAGAAL